MTPKEATVQAGPYGLAVYLNNERQPRYQIGPDGTLSLSMRRDEVTVSSQHGTQGVKTLRLMPLGPGDMTLNVKGTTRSYSGSLAVTADRGEALRLINHVPLEDYVASVVASEYGLSDLEGSKAMAVIARTYGLKVINSSDDSYDHVDHTASQVYRGSRAVTSLARQAAQATAGQVLTYDGRLIEAVYSSSSGGHTANNEDVWSSDPHPYLRGKPDPWDRVSKYHRWEYSVSEDDLHRAIEQSLGLKPRSISVAESGPDGRAKRIALEPHSGRTRTIAADEFRRIVRGALGEAGLRSTRFTMKRKRGTYRFEGGGFGHGVGLSQWGAHGMANAGKSYDEILNFYYTGVRIDQRRVQGASTPAAGLLASARAAPPTVRQVNAPPPASAVTSGRSQPADRAAQPVPEHRATERKTVAAWNESSNRRAAKRTGKKRRGW